MARAPRKTRTAPDKASAAASPVNKGGRPTAYTPEIARSICERMAAGESLEAISRTPGYPPPATVRNWVLDDRDGFAEMHQRAVLLQGHHMAEEILAISNTPEVGQVVTEKPSGTEVQNRDMIEHRRLKIDARKWYLSKVLPKLFGDKLAIGGAEDLPPVKTEDVTDLARRAAFLLRAGLPSELSAKPRKTE